jgi:alpha-tubulin suppressor-like RCC1 family protein
LTHVCHHLDLRALAAVSATCKRFRRGDGALETVEMPTKSPVVTALLEHAFPGGELVPSTRPMGCAKSWVAYLVDYAWRRHRFREAPPIAAGYDVSLSVDAAGRLLACGGGAATGHGDADRIYSDPTPVAAMAGVRVQQVAAGTEHCLALGWDGRVYSWGRNVYGKLGQGDRLTRPAPALVEGLEGVRDIAVASAHSFAVTDSGSVFYWGRVPFLAAGDTLRPIVVEGFGGVRVRRVSAGTNTAFAIGKGGELFSWGFDDCGLPGHGDEQNHPSPKRVEALRGVRVRSVSVGDMHALALSEDGLVYAWGNNLRRATLGHPNVDMELLPKQVEALRGVQMGSIAAGGDRSYAMSCTGELWAWGVAENGVPPLGHGEQRNCLLPKRIASLQGIKVRSVAANENHTLALAEDGGVYAWGHELATRAGALGLGSAGTEAVPTPQRLPALLAAYGL